jgi:chromodomain-helicase-DNA-binding protein 1
MNMDEILERDEKVEEKIDEEQGNELLSAFKVRYVKSTMDLLFKLF